MKLIKNLISKSTQFIRNIINELFILSGISVVVYTTYTLDETLGKYLIGLLLILFGLFLASTRRE